MVTGQIGAHAANSALSMAGTENRRRYRREARIKPLVAEVGLLLGSAVMSSREKRELSRGAEMDSPSQVRMSEERSRGAVSEAMARRWGSFA